MCEEIPSLCPGQDLDPRKIKVRTYPLCEQQGLIWVFVGDRDFDLNLAPPIPVLRELPMDVEPKVVEVATFKCHVDHAVIGLMDPAHGPYVHRSWLWRSEKTMVQKAKKFGPVEFGFQMRRHRPSANSKAYKILGAERTTEITFTLPSNRVEHIKVGKNKNLYSFTCLTPVNEKETVIHQLLYWDIGFLNLLRPLLQKFAHFFLWQDIDAVEKQQEGLRFEPSLMLIRDADTQAKWYYALKEEWQKFLQTKGSFHNPVPETVLEWRS
ncbi:MAG: aromatic ring-hydroxylating dioxygenase subunit alpha [Bdellovibrionaceae bacterium]|nr:aromatic ring-hydroxylating dioxygenase subunit alpha [Pseudobdellovibrionaceae bacterium]